MSKYRIVQLYRPWVGFFARDYQYSLEKEYNIFGFKFWSQIRDLYLSEETAENELEKIRKGLQEDKVIKEVEF